MKNNPKQTQSLKNQPDPIINNFSELDQGYTHAMMLQEAQRCLGCKHEPCVKACPLHIPIPQFIAALKEDKIDLACEIIRTKSDFSAFCSRVCDVARQCEGACVRAFKQEAVGISYLERYVSDNREPEKIIPPLSNGYKVAIIGSGPSGMACAQDLAKQGFKVSLFSKESYAGGILAYGVPNYRLPRTLLHLKLEELHELGVSFVYNKALGTDFSLEDLLEEYDAVFLGIGEEGFRNIGVEGEDLKHIYTSYEYLKRVNENRIGELADFNRVIVVGGGNTAMDCARVARRLGAEVILNYRRTVKEMPATKKEIEEALEEGVIFDVLSSLVKIEGKDNVERVVCIRRETTVPDERGRLQTQIIPGSEYVVEADCVIQAVGSVPNRSFRKDILGLKLNEYGHIWVDEKYQTSMEGVYAGGDLIHGADTVVRAVATGKKAARAIAEKLLNI